MPPFPKRMKILYICLAVSAVLAGRVAALTQSVPQSSNKNSGGTPTTSVAIKAFHDSSKAGVSIVIEVTLTNTSNNVIRFSRLLSGADSKIDARDINGKSAPDTRFGYAYNGHVAQLDPALISPGELNDNLIPVTVGAGQATTWQINVSKFYDMSRAGKYNIQIQREDPENPTLTVKSNLITVTVMP
jgi:hypothetical protein